MNMLVHCDRNKVENIKRIVLLPVISAYYNRKHSVMQLLNNTDARV